MEWVVNTFMIQILDACVKTQIMPGMMVGWLVVLGLTAL